MSDGFDFGNARVRARRAALLDEARYRELAALDVDRLLAALADTPYRPDLEAAAARHRGRGLLDEALRTHLARTLRELAGWYPADAAAELGLVLERWDLRNVRTILRGQHARRPPDEIRAALVPAGRLGDDVLGELAVQPTLRATVDLMAVWGVPSRAIASAAVEGLARFEATGDYAALERAVERAASARLARALPDATPEVAGLLRAAVDRANLLTVARLLGADQERWEAGDPAEEFVAGGAVPTQLLARVARAGDRAAAVALLAGAPLPAAWAPAVARWGQSGNVVALGDDLDEAVTRRAASMFATADPLGPGVPVAFVAAKENEVQNLRTIGAGLAAGLPAEMIEEELVIL